VTILEDAGVVILATNALSVQENVGSVTMIVSARRRNSPRGQRGVRHGRWHGHCRNGLHGNGRHPWLGGRNADKTRRSSSRSSSARAARAEPRIHGGIERAVEWLSARPAQAL
jgi:hypothetical protein